MSQPEAFDFDQEDVAPISIEVKYDGKEYVLKEASEGVVARYKNACMRASKLSDGRLSGIDGLADADAILVAGCLFEVRGDGKLGAVSLGFVQGMRRKVSSKLFEAAKRISGLDTEGDTISTLEKEIISLQKRLSDLKAAKDVNDGKETPLPNGSQSSTESTSD